MQKKNEPAELVKLKIPVDATLDTLPEVRSFLQAELGRGHIILITGLSGTGKSYISQKLMTNETIWILAEDYGEIQGSHWVLNVPEERFVKGRIMTGMGHNIETEFRRFVQGRLKDKDKPLNGITLVYVFPDFEIYSKANALKALKDGPHRSYFLAQSKLSPTAVARTLERNLDAFIRRLKPFASGHELAFKIAVVRNHHDGSEIQKAWHETETKIKKEEVTND